MEETQVQVDSRLARLEAELTGLLTELRRSEESRANWETKVEQKLDSITSRRTDWGVIISGVSVLVVIGVLVLTPIDDNINRALSETHRLELESEESHKAMIRTREKDLENLRREVKDDLESAMEVMSKRDDELSTWLKIIDLDGPRNLNKEIGSIEELKHKIDDVDHYGSRKWVQKDPEHE